MRTTLTDEVCANEGNTEPAPGRYTIAVENRTSYFGAFALAALDRGATIETLAPFLDEARRTFDETGRLPDPPAYDEQVVRGGLDAGASSSLPLDVKPGAYALMCFVDDRPRWRGYAAAQLDVTE